VLFAEDSPAKLLDCMAEFFISASNVGKLYNQAPRIGRISVVI
jgi:hypothetical protein